MKKGFIQYMLIISYALALPAQTREFLITPPEGKNYESIYGFVKFIDSRYDTLDHGFILNNGKKVPLVVVTSFAKQLSNYLEAVVDTSVAKEELLFHLKRFKLVERRDVDFEYGYLFFRATTYAQKGSSYYRLYDLDTLIILNGGDITDTLMDDGRTQFTSLILRSLKLSEQGKLEYSYGDIVHMEEQEKKSMPLFTCSTYSNGVYLSYASFREQRPDYTGAQFSYKWNAGVKIKVKDKEGKTLKLSGKDIYAFTDKEIPYVVTDQGVCIVERKNGNLYYVARDRVSPDNEEYAVNDIVAASLGKRTETAVSANPARGTSAYFISRIDHVDGRFMRVKRVK